MWGPASIGSRLFRVSRQYVGGCGVVAVVVVDAAVEEEDAVVFLNPAAAANPDAARREVEAREDDKAGSCRGFKAEPR
jgi:hypothetical protein